MIGSLGEHSAFRLYILWSIFRIVLLVQLLLEKLLGSAYLLPYWFLGILPIGELLLHQEQLLLLGRCSILLFLIFYASNLGGRLHGSDLSLDPLLIQSYFSVLHLLEPNSTGYNWLLGILVSNGLWRAYFWFHIECWYRFSLPGSDQRIHRNKVFGNKLFSIGYKYNFLKYSHTNKEIYIFFYDNKVIDIYLFWYILIKIYDFLLTI